MFPDTYTLYKSSSTDTSETKSKKNIFDKFSIVDQNSFEISGTSTNASDFKIVSAFKTEQNNDEVLFSMLMSEKVLSKEWDSPEEDAAWAYLQDEI